MADGSLGGEEWNNFGDFSSSLSNDLGLLDNFETENNLLHQRAAVKAENEEKKATGDSEWTANFSDPIPVNSEEADDFGSFGNFEEIPSKKFIDEDLESRTDNLLRTFDDSKCKPKDIISGGNSSLLNNLFIQSTLSSVLLSTRFDPVKYNETHFHHLKNENISSMLCVDQVVEQWISMLHKVDPRAYFDDFDFHDTSGRQPSRLTNSSLSIYKNSTNTLTMPDIPKKSIRETVLNDTSIVIDKKVERNLIKVNTHQKSQLPQLENAMKKTSSELESKSLEEVRNLVYELELQANIYSELLCNELDYRDKLKRDIEGQNNFISTYVAVERKLNDSIQNKKKKNRYGFFKANEDDNCKTRKWPRVLSRKNTTLISSDMESMEYQRNDCRFHILATDPKPERFIAEGFFNYYRPPVSIPYIQREGGPKPADLTLITEILKAIENDDPGVSKLISDYVLNLGDQHNLQTVIQVRTRNGVTSLSTPQHKKKNMNGVDEL